MLSAVFESLKSALVFGVSSRRLTKYSFVEFFYAVSVSILAACPDHRRPLDFNVPDAK
jgi:hypothetical protein